MAHVVFTQHRNLKMRTVALDVQFPESDPKVNWPSSPSSLTLTLMLNGTTITPDVDPTDPVLWVKEQIEGFTGVDGLPVVDGETLADGKTLAECLMPIGEAVSLTPVKGNLKVRDANGMEHKVPVHPYDTLMSLKARLQPLLGTDGAIKLYHNGKEFGAKPASDTFDDLKGKLEKVEGGVPKSKAPPFHLGAGGTTLADANVQQFNVNVRGPDRKTFQMNVTPGGFRNTFGDPGDEKGGEDALLFMSLIYLSFLMVRFVIGLDNRPEDVSLVYRVSIFYFSALLAFTVILSLVPLFSLEIWLTRDENYCDEAKEDAAEGVEGAEKKTKVQGESGVSSASAISTRDDGRCETILMGCGCTGTGFSISNANEVSESSESVLDMVPSPTSTGVVANVPHRRDGSVGPINIVKCLGFTNALIEHPMHTISAFVVLLRISFFIIGYAMGANAILSTVANVPEGLLLIPIGLTLTDKRKRMLATNREGVETIGCTSCACSEMGTLTQNNFMNGTASSACTIFCSVCCFPPSATPVYVCKQ
jgi:hypothetical protein